VPDYLDPAVNTNTNTQISYNPVSGSEAVLKTTKRRNRLRYLLRDAVTHGLVLSPEFCESGNSFANSHPQLIIETSIIPDQTHKGQPNNAQTTYKQHHNIQTLIYTCT
jgi:hypothetical protein